MTKDNIHGSLKNKKLILGLIIGVIVIVSIVYLVINYILQNPTTKYIVNEDSISVIYLNKKAIQKELEIINITYNNKKQYNITKRLFDNVEYLLKVSSSDYSFYVLGGLSFNKFKELFNVSEDDITKIEENIYKIKGNCIWINGNDVVIFTSIPYFSGLDFEDRCSTIVKYISNKPKISIDLSGDIVIYTKTKYTETYTKYLLDEKALQEKISLLTSKIAEKMEDKIKDNLRNSCKDYHIKVQNNIIYTQCKLKSKYLNITLSGFSSYFLNIK